MKTNSLLSAALLVTLFAGGLGSIQAAEAPASSSAADFINYREAVWFKYKSPHIEEAYPFGRSNAANNAKLDKEFDYSKVSKDSDLRNKRYLVENDWYAVEWHYAATSVATGRRQVESSLCLAQVKDGRLVWWIEYFDDTVGELQMEGKLPLPSADEEPFPWPVKATLKRVYRP